MKTMETCFKWEKINIFPYKKYENDGNLFQMRENKYIFHTRSYSTFGTDTAAQNTLAT